MMRPGRAVWQALRRSFQSQGRACRSEFWWFWVFTLVVEAATTLLDDWLFSDVVGANWADLSGTIVSNSIAEIQAYPISTFIGVCLCLPLTTVSVRRMHDLDRSGWLAGTVMLLSTLMSFLAAGLFISAFPHVIKQLFPSDGFPEWNEGSWLISGPVLLIMALNLYVFVRFIFPGTRGPNRFGRDPWGDDGPTGADVFD